SFIQTFFGMIRHELDSPNMGGHLPHHSTLCYVSLPMGAQCLICRVETCDEIPTLASVTEYINEQLKDPKLKSTIKVLKRGHEYQNYLLKDGVLYKKTFGPMAQQCLLVVPKELRGDILRSLHDGPTAGHLGFAKTYDRIRRKYYWPGLYGSIRRYISHCKKCQRRKTPPQLPPGRLQPIEPPDMPFAKVGIDLLGRFPVTRSGNRWTIVCTDYLTRFTVTKALPTGEAIEIAKFIVEEIILKHGSPKEMISDRGRTFLSNLVKTINELCQTSHLLTTAYHPQTNGLTSDEARQLAKIHIKDAQASDKQRYDARHRSVSYEIWDLVWVYTPIRKVGLSEKLLRRYFGPYRITRQMSEVTYEVESMETDNKRRKLKGVVHVLRIKPYYEPKKQLGEEQHVVVARRPVTRSQTRKQRDAVL
ncbi:Retrovirus-related Pol polyprotein from transposon 412, partial [Araneus ventricosus]